MQVFQQTFLAILQIAFIALAAGLLVRMKVFKQEHISGLSVATVYLFLPCMMFDSISRQFDPASMPYWWLLPVSSVAIFLFGFAVASLLFARRWREKRNMIGLACLQNASYLVLPIGRALLPDDAQFAQFSVYCFLYLIIFSPMLWSVGKYLATSSDDGKLPNWRNFITPPLIATLLALALVATKTAQFIPQFVVEPIHLLGTAAVPVATFVLGASLGSIRLRFHHYFADAAKSMLVKLILMPLATLLALRALGVPPTSLLGIFLIIEAASAPATSFILQVRAYGGDEERIGSVIFLHYLLLVFTLPLWYALWVTR